MAGSVRAPSGQVEPTPYYGPAASSTPKVEAADASKAKKPKDQQEREETPNRESNTSAGNNSSSEVRIKLEEGSKKPVIQFVDSKTGDVTRQVPTEDVLNAAKKLGVLAGLFFEKEG